MAIFNRDARLGKGSRRGVPEGEAGRPRRLLVLGSDGHGRGVTAYPWDKLPDGLNVADHDVVVLNFAAFDDRTLAHGFPKERLPSEESLARLVFSPNSEIIAIGDPSTLIGAPPDAEDRFFDSRRRADYWLPCWLGVEEDQGTSYTVNDEEWQPYFELFAGWSWIATGEARASSETSQYLRPVTADANNIRVYLEPVAETRFRKAIALKVKFIATRDYPGDPTGYGPPQAKSEPLMASSPVIWLPAPTEVSPSEAIDVLLRERYGVAEEARQPEWADRYSLPAEAPIREEIAALEEERRKAERKLADARERAAEAAEANKLLYEKGKDVLEPIVRSALRYLGAEVRTPEADGIEDGLLIRSEGAAVLEIKGREAQIRQTDVRQVVQWATDARLRDGIDYKPIIVGNPHCETSPLERGDPLAPNATTYAENGDVALVTTTQIYEGLRRKQAGDFDEEGFWRTIFESKGHVDLAGPPAPG